MNQCQCQYLLPIKHRCRQQCYSIAWCTLDKEEFTENYWGILEITENYWGLLEITENYWGLLEITRVLIQLLFSLQVKLLSSLDHPYIVRYYGTVTDKPPLVAAETFLVTGTIACVQYTLPSNQLQGFACWQRESLLIKHSCSSKSLMMQNYPACACAAGVKQCHHVCVCVYVCVLAKEYLKTLQAGQLGHLKMLYSVKNQQNRIGTFMYLTQVKAVLFAIISLLSVSWLHPFQNRLWYLWSANQLHARKITGIPGIDLACLAT